MDRGTVVVTGSSTGIGLATARMLAAKGFSVLAGVRGEVDGERLRALDAGRIDPVRLDVTSEDDIAALAERVDAERLVGLVNNAGIAVPGAVELLTTDDWRRQFEVNLFGAAAVTKALIPALVSGRGRIVNVSSIAGFLAPPLLGAYAASKHALEGFSDALRRELQGTGVRVVVVEPGDVATPIWSKGRAEAEDLLSHAPLEVRARYADLVVAVMARSESGMRSGMPAEDVAAVILEALTADRLRTRYPVGREARIMARARHVLPDRAVDRILRRLLR
jgi:NAD(P)-dependent dehydrogenase (short-subunit alcohol dehydrogenase family)